MSVNSSSAFGGLKQAVVEATAETLDENRRQMTALLQTHLQRGEQLQGFERGETSLPLVLQIVPFIPDVIKAPKVFLLAVTDHRILIVKLKRSLLRRLVTGTEVFASIPFAQLATVTPKRGVMTSSLAIGTQAGRTYRYTGMLISAADRFATTLAEARS